MIKQSIFSQKFLPVHVLVLFGMVAFSVTSHAQLIINYGGTYEFTSKGSDEEKTPSGGTVKTSSDLSCKEEFQNNRFLFTHNYRQKNTVDITDSEGRKKSCITNTTYSGASNLAMQTLSCTGSAGDVKYVTAPRCGNIFSPREGKTKGKTGVNGTIEQTWKTDQEITVLNKDSRRACIVEKVTVTRSIPEPHLSKVIYGTPLWIAAGGIEKFHFSGTSRRGAIMNANQGTEVAEWKVEFPYSDKCPGY